MHSIARARWVSILLVSLALAGAAVAQAPAVFGPAGQGLSAVFRPQPAVAPKFDTTPLPPERPEVVREVERLVRKYHLKGASLPVRAYGSVSEILAALNEGDSSYEPARYATLGGQADDAFRWHGLKVTGRNGKPTIIGCVAGRAAAKAGLAVGDEILAVNDRAAEGVPVGIVCGWVLGAEQTLTLAVRGSTGIRTVVLGRDNPARIEPHQTLSGDVLGIAIPGFERGTATRVAQLIQDAARRRPLRGIVLDLRGCPGGFLNEMVQVARLLLPSETPIAWTARENRALRVGYQMNRAPVLPLAVLVDGGTTGCAEVLAQTVHEAKLGLVVGTTTLGKDSVQSRMVLGDGSVLNLTTDTLLSGQRVSIAPTGMTPEPLKIEPGQLPVDEALDLPLYEAARRLLAPAR